MVVQLAPALRAPAPAGFQWVYNRLTTKYVKTFDGIAEEFAPHEYRMLSVATAGFLVERSSVKEDPFDPSRTLFAIVPEGDPNFSVPLPAEEVGIERMDRTHGDYVVKPSKDGLKTTAQAVPVQGQKLAILPAESA